jgi:hypothetical protein
VVKRSSDEGHVFKKNFTKYKLVDFRGTEITLDELIDKYYNNPEECFVRGYLEMKEVDGNNHNSSVMLKSVMAMATRNNVSYQHQIIQKIFANNPVLRNNILTEFPEKVIEESYSTKSTESPITNKDDLYWTKGKWRDYLES